MFLHSLVCTFFQHKKSYQHQKKKKKKSNTTNSYSIWISDASNSFFFKK